MEKISKYGYLRVKSISPLLKVGNVKFNSNEIIKEINQAYQDNVSIVVFPEMSLCGYTVDDLVHQQYMIDNVKRGLKEVLEKTKFLDIYFAIGLPYQMDDGRLYNSAIFAHKGKILGMTLKQNLPNYGEFYDMRYYTSGLDKSYNVEFNNQVFFAGNQIFKIKDKNNKTLASVALEICEDAWAVIPPSFSAVISGADIILNLSASNELVSKNEYRKEMLSHISSRLNCCYVYSGSKLESSKDTLFAGCGYIFENGNLLGETERFVLDKSSSCLADLDMQRIAKERRQNTTFESSQSFLDFSKTVETIHSPEATELKRTYLKNPFLFTENPQIFAERCEEILNIQSTSLAQNMIQSNQLNLILPLSGGLDSTMALLVCIKAVDKLKLPRTNIHAVSMPCFGTSNRTKNNAKKLAETLQVDFREIDIKDIVNQNLKALDHENKIDNVFENVQARERTLIAFNLANKYNGLVVGTGNLNELSLGWLTVNADQQSNYSVNCGLSKRMIRQIVNHVSQKENKLKDILQDILNTKVSPELLPTENGEENKQNSEEILGDYDVIEFCLYWHFRGGFTKNKIKYLIKQAYKGDIKNTPEILEKTIDLWFKKFHWSAFKRSNLPAGVKIGSVSYSPRADLRMPDITSYEDED